MISAIVAMDRNRNIGFEGDMPWGCTMQTDLERFKHVTTDKTIIMGRKTFESLPCVLPRRKHIVLTKSDFTYNHPNVEVYNNYEDVLDAIDWSPAWNFTMKEEVIVIGGAEIYNLFMPYVQKLYVTRVHANLMGDTKFPCITGTWTRNAEDYVIYRADENNKYGYTFYTMERG